MTYDLLFITRIEANKFNVCPSKREKGERVNFLHFSVSTSLHSYFFRSRPSWQTDETTITIRLQKTYFIRFCKTKVDTHT